MGPLQSMNNCSHIFTITDRTSKWMEVVPLVKTSAAACAKALTFSWISRFRVPKTITSDCGPQFTSNLWSQLCLMLNIAHRQTTAYHPESNGAVERLQRLLKDALPARAPPRQLGPISYLLYYSVFELRRGKTLVFPWLNLFLEPQLSSQMSSWSVMSLLLILLLKFSKKA